MAADVRRKDLAGGEGSEEAALCWAYAGEAEGGWGGGFAARV